MDVIAASRKGEMSGVLLPFVLFSSARRMWRALAAVLVLGALTALYGLVNTPLPTTVSSDEATIPLWRLLAMGAGAVPVLTLHSPLAGLESAATRRLRRMQRACVAGLGVGSAGLYLCVCAISLDAHTLMIIARAWVGWFGLALIAGTLLGWRMAWTLPSLVAVALWYWGFQGRGQYWWWEFTARPHDDLPALLVVLALLGVGLLTYSMTPWRRRRLSGFSRVRGNRRGRILGA